MRVALAIFVVVLALGMLGNMDYADALAVEAQAKVDRPIVAAKWHCKRDGGRWHCSDYERQG